MKKLLLVLLISISFAKAQNAANLFFNANGERAAAMGNAYTALSDEVLALAWNPAGLGYLRSYASSVVGRFGFGNSTITGFEQYGINSWNVDINSWTQLNFIGIVVPFEIESVKGGTGLSFRRIYNLTKEQNHTIKTAEGDTYSYHDNSDGGVDAFTLAVGVRVHKAVSLGLTLNYLVGSVDGFKNLNLNNQSDPSNYVTYHNRYSGFSAEAGILVKPMDFFSLGAYFSIPYTVTEDTTGGGTVDLGIPMSYSLGVAIFPTDHLVFSLDYRNQPISSVTVDGIKLKSLYGTEDTYSIHIGGEWQTEKIAYRLGFYKNKKTENILNPDQVYTGGVGIKFGTFIINAALEYTNTEIKQNFDLDDESIPFTQNTSEWRITIGAQVYFFGTF
ncbi:MAG TPA: hypothetical protein EYP36_08610 [Calditrichaeota bacterium]|nr:hypothetical protein [Calditrichota bacterium]